MTAKDSADRVLGAIATAGATALKYRQLCPGPMRTHSRWRRSARIWDFRRRGWTPVYLKLRSCLTDVHQTPESRARNAVACPRKARIKSKKMTVNPILEQINATRFPNGRYQKLQPTALPERSSSACPSLTTCSTAVAVTSTSAL